ncbi:MAG: peptide-methionine (S)-S-oxide reductase MsrA [Eggerthella lenta]
MTNADSAGSETPAELRTLYLAGGCFWGLEAYLKRLPGVRGTVVGYANGSTENPSYHDVCRWNTGHAETVAVTYDPRVLPTDVLLDAFFEAIDPTSVDRQGNDRGTQYRSGIYWTDEADLPAIEASLLRQQRAIRAPSSPRWSRSTATRRGTTRTTREEPGRLLPHRRSQRRRVRRAHGTRGRRYACRWTGWRTARVGRGAATAARSSARTSPRRPCRVAQTKRNEDGLADADVDALIREAGYAAPPTTSCAACCRPTSTALRA